MGATDMLVCGEDLGMIPACVHPVMAELGLIGAWLPCCWGGGLGSPCHAGSGPRHTSCCKRVRSSSEGGGRRGRHPTNAASQHAHPAPTTIPTITPTPPTCRPAHPAHAGRGEACWGDPLAYPYLKPQSLAPTLTLNTKRHCPAPQACASSGCQQRIMLSLATRWPTRT